LSYPLWQHNCPKLTDIDFIRLGLIRCMGAIDSEHYFLQIADEIQHACHTEKGNNGTAFNKNQN
jgi:hypothetical protein